MSSRNLYTGRLILIFVLGLAEIGTAAANPALQSEHRDVTHRSSLTGRTVLPVGSPAASAFPAAGALPNASSYKPLTPAQLMGLVAGGVATKRVSALVAQRGIAFQPTPEFLTDLKSAGASDALLNALRAAGNEPTTRSKEDAHSIRAPPDLSAPPDQLSHLRETEQEDRAAEVARPQDPSVHYALAGVLGQEGKWGEAAAQYAAVTASQPSDVAARNNFALALRKSGDIDGAIREYRRALAIDPTLATVHDNLGVALSQKGDVNGAIAEFREAIRQDPKNAQAHHNLGAMLALQKDYDGAIREDRQALTLGGSNDTQYNLAVALQLKRDLDGAIAEFHQAVPLFHTTSSRPHVIEFPDLSGKAHGFRRLPGSPGAL